MNRFILPVNRTELPSRRGRAVRRAAAFNELLFSPPPATQPEYYAQVAEGYDRIRKRRVVIAGLARDIDQVLPQTIQRIERQGEMFLDYRVIIYENDSSDATCELLHDWAARNPRVTAICEQRGDPVNQPSRCLSRAARMAYYRARCHELITHEFPRYDAVILVDTDLAGGWSLDGVAHTFGQENWDFVGANGIIYRRKWLQPNMLAHYDAWAFRNDPEFTPLSTRAVNRMLFFRGEPLKHVYSCFGGVGIYRMAAYLSGRYDGSDIEHVTFHREMHRRGYDRTYLNPNLIAVYGRKHRSLDRYAAKLIRLLDLLPGRQAVIWHYPGTSEKSIPTEPAPRVRPRRAA